MEQHLYPVGGSASFLKGYIDFRQHIEELYGDLTNIEKGRLFSNLVKDTLSSHESYWGLEARLNPKETHDEGVDIFWVNPENNKDKFFCQSKFRIRSKDDFDNVISKFKGFEESQVKNTGQKQLDIFSHSLENTSSNSKEFSTKYIVATLWSLKNIVSSYEASGRPSVNFYHQLVENKRLEIIDGELLYDYFLSAYEREYSIPQEVRFRSKEALVNRENVHVGVISTEDLISIYKKSRNGIFFENVRDFLGLGNSDSTLDINNDIYKTACTEPSKMIERNNGITFKASSIDYEENWVVLRNAGIINGCQTTICIVKAAPKEECYVPVKIVITGDDEQTTSDIARTANTQNRIDKINLELSEFIRPQLIKMSLAEVGISLAEDKQENAPLLAATISKYQVFKSDIRYLFIGLFSSTPRNIFISDYAAIRFDDLKTSFSTSEKRRELNSILAQILVISNKSFEKIREKYPVASKKEDGQDSSETKIGKVFNRFYIDQKGYKAYLIVLAIYCILKIDDEKAAKGYEITRTLSFVKNILNDDSGEFQESLEKIFRAVAMNVIQRFSSKEKDLEDEISQNLFKYMRSTNFSAFYMFYEML
jgi:AIPR protein